MFRAHFKFTSQPFGERVTADSLWLDDRTRQALARLHALAAADLVDEDRLGRPRADAEIGPRLELLVDVVTGKSDVPAAVLAAVAHGELLTLAPFGSADGLVARGVSRLVTIANGLDPHGLGVPEVYWMRQSVDYHAAAGGFAYTDMN